MSPSVASSASSTATSAVSGALTVGSNLKVCSHQGSRIWDVKCNDERLISYPGCWNYLGHFKWHSYRIQFCIQEEGATPFAGGRRGRRGCRVS